jgi:D-alanine-D-alanine ligase
VLRVLHLTGSAVSDFHADLSRLYAADCLAATADPARYEVHVAFVHPGGRWSFPAGLSREEIEAAPTMAVGEAVAHLRALEVDVAVPQMFCLPGMTTYRALLELLAIPYVGNRPETMALGAHKARARSVVAAAGVPVPVAEVLRRGERATLPPPVVVKPVDADNSHGIALVRSDADYPAALAEAFEHAGPDGEVLVETYVPLGREVRCGVVERGGPGGGLVVLPLEEYAVDEVGKPIRDAADKLAVRDDGDLRLVAKDAEHAWIVDRDDPLTDHVGELARRAHRALGCRDYSLFDFRVDAAGQAWFLEAGLYCSFARQSVVSVMAHAAGTALDDLFADAVRRAVARG